MDHPTIFVSKEQAAITLARFLARKKPAEARKLLDPLRNQIRILRQSHFHGVPMKQFQSTCFT